MIEDVVAQLGKIETAGNIMGVMIESHLVAGQSSLILSSFFLLPFCALR